MRKVALALGCGVAAASPAAAERARTTISPYIEVQQVLSADLNGGDFGDDVLTYTSVAAGVDASVSTRRAQATISYRYERRIPWNDDLNDTDVHTGLATGHLEVAPNLLSLDGGAIATRARNDIRGEAPGLFVGDQGNVSQIYGVYAGPTLATRVGDLQVGASYRFGYVKAENKSGVRLAPGAPRLDSYDSSTIHQVDASVGMAAGPLPFGWTVSGGYAREDARQLDQRYDGKYVRGDVTLPVSPTLALTGGAGYEDIEISQRAPLRNPDGSPVTDTSGRFVTDPSSPRLLSFETDGLIWDAGVIWRPNRRTTLQARYGRRYGAWAATGSLDWQIDERSGLRIGVYNYLDSFGRSLTRNIGSLPTEFTIARSPFTQTIGCVTGTTPGTGGCLTNSLQSVSTSNFRSRGAFALYSRTAGPWNMSLGGGYAQRKFLAPDEQPFFSVDGSKDETWFVQGNIGRQLTAASGIDASVFANWYSSSFVLDNDVTSYGATTSYYHYFGRRLSATAAAGIYAFEQDGFETDVNGSLLLGMRYQF